MADIITADTITNEQIIALRDEAQTVVLECVTALGEVTLLFRPLRSEVLSARASCAEILNARKATP